MSRPFQHIVPFGILTALLFFFAQRYTDYIVEVVCPISVPTVAVVGCVLLLFYLSAGFSGVLFVVAHFVERVELLRHAVARFLPLFLPILLSPIVWLLSHFYMLGFFYWLGGLFVFSAAFGIYWAILLCERLIVYGFYRLKHEASA